MECFSWDGKEENEMEGGNGAGEFGGEVFLRVGKWFGFFGGGSVLLWGEEFFGRGNGVFLWEEVFLL